MKVNLNDTIKFRVTEHGQKILNTYFIELEEYYKLPKDCVDYEKEKFSKDIIEMQLWEFMNIFGNAQFCGADAISQNNEIEVCGTN